MPAFVNISVGSLRGTRGEDGTISCPAFVTAQRRGKRTRKAHRPSRSAERGRFIPRQSFEVSETRSYKKTKSPGGWPGPLFATCGVRSVGKKSVVVGFVFFRCRHQ